MLQVSASGSMRNASDDRACADDRGDHWTRLADRRGDVQTQPAVLERELQVQEGTAARLAIGEFDRCPIARRGQPESHPVREVLSLRVFTQRCPCRETIDSRRRVERTGDLDGPMQVVDNLHSRQDKS
jgi:hypothetical protein